MSFQIELDPFDRAYAHFVRRIREAIQKTFAEEAQEGLTQKDLAEALQIDESLVSRRLNGPGNITLKTLSDLFTAMGRAPLSNFVLRSTSANPTPSVKYSEDWIIQKAMIDSFVAGAHATIEQIGYASQYDAPPFIEAGTIAIPHDAVEISQSLKNEINYV